MRKLFNFFYIFPVLILVIVAFIFHSWFFPGVITGGDFPYFYPQLMHSTNFLYSWGIRQNGLGSSMLITLWLESYFYATTQIASFGWQIYERIVWFFPYLIFSVTSSYLFFRYLFGKSWAASISSLLYSANTYALMMVGGGQMGIALSYSLVPFGLLALEYLLRKLTINRTLIFSVCFSVVLLLDIRIAYIVVFAFVLRSLLFFVASPEHVRQWKIYGMLVIGVFAIVGLHAFWLLPTLMTHGSAVQHVGDIYTSVGSVKYFSFANFENALGLLHPNWPENIFGKTGFMKPEFLLLPLLAYGALFFIKRKTENMKQKRENTYVLFFALLGLIGVFLAKGENDPFGGVYLWMFNHVPGFIMFRDPTKWYLLIAISYSMLIPFTVGKVYAFLKGKKFSIKFKIFNVPNVFLIGVLLYLLFLIRPALLGQLGGTFKGHQVPSDYVKLEKFLDSQQGFSRTFWVPTTQRFGFFSITHPAIAAEDFFHVTSIGGVLNRLQSHLSLIQEAGVKYVIVPYDSEGEIFLRDRKYDNRQYLAAVTDLGKISYLTEIPGFGKIHVFEVSHPKDHFFLVGTGTVTYKNINPTKYEVSLKDVTKGQRLVFSEGYDMYWVAEQQTQDTGSKPYESLFNSFVLPKSGDYTLTITYAPQKWVDVGVWVSGLTLLGIVGFFLLFLKRSAKLQ